MSGQLPSILCLKYMRKLMPYLLGHCGTLILGIRKFRSIKHLYDYWVRFSTVYLYNDFGKINMSEIYFNGEYS